MPPMILRSLTLTEEDAGLVLVGLQNMKKQVSVLMTPEGREQLADLTARAEAVFSAIIADREAYEARQAEQAAQKAEHPDKPCTECGADTHYSLHRDTYIHYEITDHRAVTA